MLLHASIAASAPGRVAAFFERLWRGETFDFHPVPGGLIVMADDGNGSAVEIYPAGTVNRMGADAVEFQQNDGTPTESATHLAVATPLSRQEIFALANDFDWPARLCDRGPFTLIEVWVEKTTLVEVFTPAQQQAYRAAMTVENWRAWS